MSVRRKAERLALLAQLCLLLTRPASPSYEVNHTNSLVSMALALSLLQTLSKEHRKHTSLLHITLGIPGVQTETPTLLHHWLLSQLPTGATMCVRNTHKLRERRSSRQRSRTSEGQRGVSGCRLGPTARLSSSGERQASCTTPQARPPQGRAQTHGSPRAGAHQAPAAAIRLSPQLRGREANLHQWGL